MSVGPWQGLDAMASAEREPILGVWVQVHSPQLGGGAKPPEAECLLHFACPKEATNLPHY